jgi:hypothetical protein
MFRLNIASHLTLFIYVFLSFIGCKEDIKKPDTQPDLDDQAIFISDFHLFAMLSS